MAFSWETEAVEILRVMIDDMEDAPTYSNDKLVRLLLVSAFQVNRDATFAQDFEVDLTEQTITPDPSDNDAGDENFINLMTLKAACLMERGAASKAAGNAIAGKDMNAVQFDLTGVADSTLKLLRENWCKKYEDVLYNYISGDGNLGQAVMGPFRTYARWG